MEVININTDRLSHLLSLFRVTEDELLAKLNHNRKKKLGLNDIFNSEIKFSILKKIDEIFNKGLEYYLDPQPPLRSKEESIFFRKDDFNAELSLGAKQVVSRFEDEKIEFDTLSKLIEFTSRRVIGVYSVRDNPLVVAEEVRSHLYPEFVADARGFLKNLITRFAEYKILVFEFVETHNKKEKANISGFFLAPNVIVLKRNQQSLRREIFTLAHELGHYLLNEEDIDSNINNEVVSRSGEAESNIEHWCNDFAYYFLAGGHNGIIEKLDVANASNDYQHSTIDAISAKTHLSTLALYTRLLLTNRISPFDYSKVSEDIKRQIKEFELAKAAELARQKQKAEEDGRKITGMAPKPIVSPLYAETLKAALFNGYLTEESFCKKLRIPAEKLENFLA